MNAGVSHHSRGAIRETNAAFIAPVVLDLLLPFAMPSTLAVYARTFPGSGIRARRG